MLGLSLAKTPDSKHDREAHHRETLNSLLF